MNKPQRHPNLPSISTLLKQPSSPPLIRINDEEEHDINYSHYKNNEYLSATLSPILSPIESNHSTLSKPSSSPISTMLSLPSSSLPPLQGDDPPRRLRHPSISSTGSNSSQQSNYNTLWNSTAGLGISIYPKSPPSTEIILSESGPILKRRRGRPPSLREPSIEGGWTFLTPTVWDVKDQLQNSSRDPPEPDSLMHGSMAAFTSSTMDMVLQMPRKKRGRKPKTHIVGNSCFVWKDIASTRRSTKSTCSLQDQEKSI